MSITLQLLLDQVYESLQRADLYYGHGTDNAWDEAVFLVLSACHLPLDSGDEVLSDEITTEQQAKISHYLQQRLQHKPLPYITHEAWFCGLPYYVDERVLIPRSPFAEWIEKKFEPWCDPQKLKYILEIGTGSGCIAIATALALPNAHVDASDISREALIVAEQNVKKHGVKNLSLIHSDVFNQIPVKLYDLIISNPPYVSAAEREDLPAEYRVEPRFALEAPNEGMEIVDRILMSALDYLSPHGVLMIEVGMSHEIFSNHYPDLPVIWLEQQRGGEGIFYLDREGLAQYLMNNKK